MKIKYKVDLEDVVIFNRYHNQNSPALVQFRKRMKWGTILGVLGICGYTSYLSHSEVNLIIGIAFATIFFFSYPLKSTKILDEYTKKLYSEGDNKRILSMHELELAEDSIKESNEYGSQVTNYSSIKKIVTTDTHGFIFIAALLAHVIPKHKVVEGDFDLFMETAKFKMNCHMS